MKDDNEEAVLMDAMEHENVWEFLFDFEMQAHIEKEYQEIINSRDLIRREVFKPEKEITVYMPINIPRIIHQSKQKFDIKPNNKSNIKPYEVVNQINTLIESICLLENKNQN